MQLVAIHRYPVKSLAGNSLTQAQVLPQGIFGDRLWLIATPEGKMITARQHLALLLWQTQIDDSGSLNIVFPDQTQLSTHTRLYQQTNPVCVWQDTFLAYTGDTHADAVLSQQLGFAVRLYYLGEHSARTHATQNTALSFADGSPFLLTNTASLNTLNQQLDQRIEMARFRANFVVSGSIAYEEESWQRLQIGEVVFQVHSPCKRCVMPTIDLHTAQKHPQQQPLRYLAQQRNTIFGVHLIAENQGKIQLGDTVLIL